MKRFFLAGFTTLVLAAAIAPAKADPTAFNPYTAAPTAAEQLSPAALVTLAQRGYLRDQGIPGYLGLNLEYSLGRIGAVELVRSAIDAKLLPAQAATDASYLNAVASQLQTLEDIH